MNTYQTLLSPLLHFHDPHQDHIQIYQMDDIHPWI